MTMNPKILDDLATRLSAAVPSGVTDLQKDVEKNFRAVLQNTFSKLNLVTREEFEVQSEVLTNTRAKLAELEQQVKELEQELLGKQSDS